MGINKNLMNEYFSDLIHLNERQYVISQIKEKKRYPHILEFLFTQSDLYTVGQIMTAKEMNTSIIIDEDLYELVWLAVAIKYVSLDPNIYATYLLNSLNPTNDISKDIFDIMFRDGYEFDIYSKHFFKLRNSNSKSVIQEEHTNNTHARTKV